MQPTGLARGSFCAAMAIVAIGDATDGETLLRTTMAWARGVPSCLVKGTYLRA
jgi:hypothetical protein